MYLLITQLCRELPLKRQLPAHVYNVGNVPSRQISPFGVEAYNCRPAITSLREAADLFSSLLSSALRGTFIILDMPSEFT